MSEAIYEIVEVAKRTGKIKKGANEVTKALEKLKPVLVVVASDVSPKEVVMHLPLLCKEKGVRYVEVPSKEELGAAAGLPVSTSAVAIIDAGDAKDMIKSLPEPSESEGSTSASESE